MDRQENAPNSVALTSFVLNLFWFGIAGVFILQDYQIGAFTIWGGWTNLFFLFSSIINCSLLIKSRSHFLFTGAGMGALGLLFMLEYISVVLSEKHELIWRLAGEAGEQIILVLGLGLAFLCVSALMFFLLWFQAGEKKFWACKALLSTQVVFVTLSLLTMLKPGGLAATSRGMTLAFAVVTLLIAPMLIAVALWYTQKHDDLTKRRVYWAVFAVQIIATMGAVYYYTVSPELRHLGESVNVREIRLGDSNLSRPFVEEGKAYLVSEDGRLLEVNLFTGSRQEITSIFLPEPAEIGYPAHILMGGIRGNLVGGKIARKSPGKLAISYVYRLWQEAEQDEINPTVDVIVNQESGQISWHLSGYTTRPGYHLAEPAEEAGITIYPHVYGIRGHLTMRITGAGIETAVDPVGEVLWTYAGQGWLLAGTNRGVLYAIDINTR